MDNSLLARLTEQIAHAVEARLGQSDPSIRTLIAQEVEAALGRGDAAALLDAAVRSHNQSEPELERIVVTANGRNRTGIVARLAAAIDGFAGDIRDISQTIIGDYFTMIIVVDIAAARRSGSRFHELRDQLRLLGEELGIHVVAMHDDILSTMHSV